MMTNPNCAQFLLRAFNCSYAFDVPCYFDFSVRARNEEHAEQLCQQALKQGVFDDQTADANWDLSDNTRVFVSAERPNDYDPQLTRQPDGQFTLD